jgi:hypothetical protein
VVSARLTGIQGIKQANQTVKSEQSRHLIGQRQLPVAIYWPDTKVHPAMLKLSAESEINPAIKFSQELLFPNGSKGNEIATAAIAMYSAAHTYIGTDVEVLAYVATIADIIPMIRLHTTAIPFPVAR